MTRERNPLVVSRVVGDVLDAFTSTVELRVYSDGRMVCNGCNFRPSQVLAQPRVEIGGNDFRSLYTL
ncbi:UNVERIFIED_CONTAM: protein HEADING DATE 3A, partial [Sesamum latifolium]